MCGLVGIIGNRDIPKPMLEVFSQMLEVNSLRGRHSTGVIRVSEKQGMKYYKRALNGPVFVDTKDGWEFISGGGKVKALLGHNRWATKGAITDKNSHPFRCGPITLMHNGTLKGQYLLPEHHRFDVDSENIAFAMEKLGEKAALEKLHGAFALVWHNKDDNTINFARNDERPLWFGITKLGNIFYASERGMLSWLMARNNILIDQWVEFPTGQHLKIPAEGVVNWDEIKATPFEEYTTFSNWRRPAANYDNGYNGGGVKYGGYVSEREALLRSFPIGTTTEVYVYGFEPYKHAKNEGVGIGYMMEKPYSKVELMGFKVGDAFGMYDASVNSVRSDYIDRKSTTVVISRQYTLVEEERDEKERDDMKDCIEECKATDKDIHDVKKSEGEAKSNVIVLPGVSTINSHEIGQVFLQITYNESRAILKKYGVTQLMTLDEKHYDAVYEETMQLIEGKQKLGEESPLAMVPGPNKKLVTAEEFEAITKHGCLNCGANIALEDAPHVFFGEQGSVYCPDCVREFFEMSGGSLH